MARGLRGRASNTTLAVSLIVILILVAVAASAVTIRLPVPAAGRLRLPWWLMIAPFAVFQAAMLNIQISREARSVSLSEIPLTVALAFCSPFGVVGGRLLGALVVYVLLQRQYRQAIKLSFNLALSVAEASVAVLLFRAVLQGSSAVGSRSWLALIIANTVASCLAALAVALIIQLFEENLSPRELFTVLSTSAPQAALVCTFGLLGVLALNTNPLSTVLLLVVGLSCVGAYRSYAALNERHLGLERVYRFTQVVSSNPEMNEISTGILSQACEMLHAENALMTFLPGAGSDTEVELTLGRSRQLRRQAAVVLNVEQAGPISAAHSGQGPVLIPRNTHDPALRNWLSRRQLRDLLAVPLHGDSGVIGVLAVTDRLGEARGFDRDDIRILETVANHASVALRNGRLVDQLRHESLHDSLTGLPNRVCFQREVESQLAALTSDRELAVGVIDLNNFKDVNDTLGHTHGDALLREVSRRLSSGAGSRALVARLGGDEFALVFASSSAEDAARFGEELLSSLHQPVLVGGVEVEVGGSLGLALSGTSGTDRVVLLKHADMAMYESKQSSAEVTVYSASIDRAAPSRLALVARLRTAVEDDAVEIYLQPQANLITGEVTGAEALLRWRDADRGLVAPDDFIPLAERSGLIRPLTELVLTRAIRACSNWQAALPGVGVAVNLSVKSLTDSGLVGQVGFLLRRYGLPHELLTLEITESSIMSDPTRTMHVLNVLQQSGIRLSIDDFGTGYSSLSYLRRLPVTEVKIDRSFVTNIASDPDNAAIARSILDLSRSLALTVVAEGIESSDAWATLRKLGCTTGQGYYISAPVPVSEFVNWHRGWVPPRLSAAIHPA